jgi:hypothetical protein
MPLNSVRLWLNAFIPNSVCEVHGDLFAIRIPIVDRLFTGDQREFSDGVDASARMHSEVAIVGLDGESFQVASEVQLCGESHEIDEDGNIIASATAPTDRMKFLNLRGSQTIDPDGGVIDGIVGSVQIDVVGSASLPLIVAPDIDYSGTFIIDRSEGNVLFRGAISGFPAFEFYFQADDGPVITLGRFNPISPSELFGEEDRPVNVSARIL